MPSKVRCIRQKPRSHKEVQGPPRPQTRQARNRVNALELRPGGPASVPRRKRPPRRRCHLVNFPRPQRRVLPRLAQKPKVRRTGPESHNRVQQLIALRTSGRSASQHLPIPGHRLSRASVRVQPGREGGRKSKRPVRHARVLRRLSLEHLSPDPSSRWSRPHMTLCSCPAGRWCKVTKRSLP